MIDREKVIKAIEAHISTDDSVGCDDCTYENDGWCMTRVMHDALALLKEQEEKPMIENEIGWNCPSCGMNLIGKSASGYPCDLIDLPEDEPIHFCPKCGQAVKWE